MFRAILGFIKGLIVGGGVGYALLSLAGGDETNFVLTYAACAFVGALVGVICGQAPWRSETIWTPVVKAIVGSVIGAILCFVGLRFLPASTFSISPLHIKDLSYRNVGVLATAIGVLYGMFVEIDDGGSKPEASGQKGRSDGKASKGNKTA